jgi:hypothetical protein
MIKRTAFPARLIQTCHAMQMATSAIEQAKKRFQDLQESLKARDADTSMPLYSAWVVSQRAQIQLEILQDKLNALESELKSLREMSEQNLPDPCAPLGRKRPVIPASKSRKRTIREWVRGILEEKNRPMKMKEIAERAVKRGYGRKRVQPRSMKKITELFRKEIEKHPEEFYKDELNKYHLLLPFPCGSESSPDN